MRCCLRLSAVEPIVGLLGIGNCRRSLMLGALGGASGMDGLDRLATHATFLLRDLAAVCVARFVETPQLAAGVEFVDAAAGCTEALAWFDLVFHDVDALTAR